MSLLWLSLISGSLCGDRSFSWSFSDGVEVISFPVDLFQALVLPSFEQVISYSWWCLLLILFASNWLALAFFYFFLSGLLAFGKDLFFSWALCIGFLIVINMRRNSFGRRTRSIDFPGCQGLIGFLKAASFERVHAPIQLLFLLCTSSIFFLFFSVSVIRSMVELHFAFCLDGKRKVDWNCSLLIDSPCLLSAFL